MAAENFDTCLAHVLEFEGGYVNHPKDPGGATNMGITHLTLAAWRKVPSVTPMQVKQLTLQEAKSIYRAQYWNAVKGDELPIGLDLVVFDSAVNNGAGRSVRFLQQELKTCGLYTGAVDGLIGAKSVNTLRQVNDMGGLIESVIGRRLAFHKRLKGWATFGKGWQRRIDSVLGLALAMNGDWSHVGDVDAIDMNKTPVRPNEVSDCRTPHDVKGACDVSAARTIEGQGAGATGIGVAGAALSEAAAQVQPLAEVSTVIKFIFIGLLVAGIAVTLYSTLKGLQRQNAEAT